MVATAAVRDAKQNVAEKFVECVEAWASFMSVFVALWSGCSVGGVVGLNHALIGPCDTDEQ